MIFKKFFHIALLALFFFSHYALSAGTWVNSGYTAAVCNNLSNLSSANAACKNNTDGPNNTGTTPYRMWNSGTATTNGSCSPTAAKIYYCQTNTNPCDPGTNWSQATQSCVAPVTCVGEQTVSPDGQSCIDPVCTSAEVFNAAAKTCDPACTNPMVQNPFNGNTCEYPCPTTGTVRLSYNINAGTPSCFGGCSIVLGEFGTQYILTDGTTAGVFAHGGQFCDDSASTAAAPCPDCTTDDSKTCPAGKVYGTFNGVSGCYDSADSAPTPTPPTETASTTTTSESTTIGEDGTKTTTTTTTTTSSSGSGSGSGGSGSGSGTISTSTTVTTVNPDGSTNTTTSEEGTTGSLQGGGFDNSGAKSFWESEYPNGLSGVWSEHQASINNAPVSQWLNSWSFGSSGSCPSFNFNFDLGFVSFGSQSISPDLFCYVFPIVRLILIISSLLLARRLVFGG